MHRHDNNADGNCYPCSAPNCAAERRGPQPARLDSNKDSTPKTSIVAHVEAGKAPWPHNIQRYELRDNKETPNMNPDNRFTDNRFTITIDLGNDAMKTPHDVAKAVREVAAGLRTMPAKLTAGGQIRDVNGNTVGEWSYNNV